MMYQIHWGQMNGATITGPLGVASGAVGCADWWTVALAEPSTSARLTASSALFI
jgi:hypothetical protein